nr:FAD-binding oxidoreductase [Oceanisphaera psychrotolerans]
MQHVNSYYAASANEHAPWPQLNDNIRCDVCVVGGGYTGLSTALFLVEAGFDVVLLEASRIGFGASGRNGGQIVNSYSRDIGVIESRYGQDTARMLGSMMFEGGDIIRSRIEQYQIDCDYRPGGIFAALNKRQLAELRAQKADWERYGHQQLEELDAGQIRQEVETEAYVGALLDHRGGHIHPLNLALGEAEPFASSAGVSSSSRRSPTSSMGIRRRW